MTKTNQKLNKHEIEKWSEQDEIVQKTGDDVKRCRYFRTLYVLRSNEDRT